MARIKSLRGTILWTAALLVNTVGLVPICQAQMQYNFSVYVDASLSDDLSTVYNGVTVQDNSSGCSHSNYDTISAITTPDGRNSQNDGAGLFSNSSIATNGVNGDYNLYSTGTFYCSCIHGNAGFGGGIHLSLGVSVNIFSSRR